MGYLTVRTLAPAVFGLAVAAYGVGDGPGQRAAFAAPEPLGCLCVDGTDARALSAARDKCDRAARIDNVTGEAYNEGVLKPLAGGVGCEALSGAPATCRPGEARYLCVGKGGIPGAD